MDDEDDKEEERNAIVNLLLRNKKAETASTLSLSSASSAGSGTASVTGTAPPAPSVATAPTGYTRLSMARPSILNTAQSYEQISVREILSRKRSSAVGAHRTSGVVAQLQREASITMLDIEERDHEYMVEAPKSGLLTREEILKPLFLPTKCELEKLAENESNPRSTTQSGQGEDEKPRPEVRQLVYCLDNDLFERYQEEQLAETKHNSKSKTHWGLHFDSRFECGNLFQAESAMKKGAPIGSPEEYDLYLLTDPIAVNPTNPHDTQTAATEHATTSIPCAQWFFFKVTNTKKRRYRFHIHHFTKPNLLYREGMLPMMISETMFRENNTGWQRIGEDLVYTSSNREALTNFRASSFHAWLPPQSHPSPSPLHTLSFTFSCEHAKDTLFFAFAPPYTYSQLQNMLFVLRKNPATKPHMEVRTLCRSVGGNRVDLVIITENGSLVKSKETLIEEKNMINGNTSFSTTTVEEEMNETVADTNYHLKDVLPGGNSDNLAFCAGFGLPPPLTRANTMRRGGILSRAPSMKEETTDSATASAQSDEDSDATAAPAKIPKFLQKLQNQMNQDKENAKKWKIEKSRKAAIIILARIHPNETCSSWIAEGIIKTLLADNAVAQALRNYFVFYIVPMVNPDGVVNGLSRNDITGFDLQDHWLNPNTSLHPAICSIKELIKNIHSTTTIAGFFDLRGHASKNGVFFHSLLPEKPKDPPNTTNTNTNDAQQMAIKKYLCDPRRFFKAMARRSNYISPKHCSMTVTKHQMTSAKVFLSKYLKVSLALTLEASMFHGPRGCAHAYEHISTAQSSVNPHLQTIDFAKVGAQLCLTLCDVFLYPPKPKSESQSGNNSRQTSFLRSTIRRATSGSFNNASRSPSAINGTELANIIENLSLVDSDKPFEANLGRHLGSPRFSRLRSSNSSMYHSSFQQQQQATSPLNATHKMTLHVGSSDHNEQLTQSFLIPGANKKQTSIFDDSVSCSPSEKHPPTVSQAATATSNTAASSAATAVNATNLKISTGINLPSEQIEINAQELNSPSDFNESIWETNKAYLSDDDYDIQPQDYVDLSLFVRTDTSKSAEEGFYLHPEVLPTLRRANILGLTKFLPTSAAITGVNSDIQCVPDFSMNSERNYRAAVSSASFQFIHVIAYPAAKLEEKISSAIKKPGESAMLKKTTSTVAALAYDDKADTECTDCIDGRTDKTNNDGSATTDSRKNNLSRTKKPSFSRSKRIITVSFGNPLKLGSPICEGEEDTHPPEGIMLNENSLDTISMLSSEERSVSISLDGQDNPSGRRNSLFQESSVSAKLSPTRVRKRNSLIRRGLFLNPSSIEEDKEDCDSHIHTMMTQTSNSRLPTILSSSTSTSNPASPRPMRVSLVNPTRIIQVNFGTRQASPLKSSSQDIDLSSHGGESVHSSHMNSSKNKEEKIKLIEKSSPKQRKENEVTIDQHGGQSPAPAPLGVTFEQISEQIALRTQQQLQRHKDTSPPRSSSPKIPSSAHSRSPVLSPRSPKVEIVVDPMANVRREDESQSPEPSLSPPRKVHMCDSETQTDEAQIQTLEEEMKRKRLNTIIQQMFPLRLSLLQSKSIDPQGEEILEEEEEKMETHESQAEDTDTASTTSTDNRETLANEMVEEERTASSEEAGNNKSKANDAEGNTREKEKEKDLVEHEKEKGQKHEKEDEEPQESTDNDISPPLSEEELQKKIEREILESVQRAIMEAKGSLPFKVNVSFLPVTTQDAKENTKADELPDLPSRSLAFFSSELGGQAAVHPLVKAETATGLVEAKEVEKHAMHALSSLLSEHPHPNPLLTEKATRKSPRMSGEGINIQEIMSLLYDDKKTESNEATKHPHSYSDLEASPVVQTSSAAMTPSLPVIAEREKDDTAGREKYPLPSMIDEKRDDLPPTVAREETVPLMSFDSNKSNNHCEPQQGTNVIVSKSDHSDAPKQTFLSPDTSVSRFPTNSDSQLAFDISKKLREETALMAKPLAPPRALNVQVEFDDELDDSASRSNSTHRSHTQAHIHSLTQSLTQSLSESHANKASLQKDPSTHAQTNTHKRIIHFAPSIEKFHFFSYSDANEERGSDGLEDAEEELQPSGKHTPHIANHHPHMIFKKDFVPPPEQRKLTPTVGDWASLSQQQKEARRAREEAEMEREREMLHSLHAEQVDWKKRSENLEELQAQFLMEMGLDYELIFGKNGVLAQANCSSKPQRKKKSESGTNLSQNNVPQHLVNLDGTFSKGFPQRQPIYDHFIAKDTLESQTRGVGKITRPHNALTQHVSGVDEDLSRTTTTVEALNEYQHHLQQYYQHILDELRRRRLAEGDQETEAMARRIFETFHNERSFAYLAPRKLVPYSRAALSTRVGTANGSNSYNQSLTTALSSTPRQRASQTSPRPRDRSPSPTTTAPAEGGERESAPELAKDRAHDRLQKVFDLQREKALRDESLQRMNVPLWLPEDVKDLLASTAMNEEREKLRAMARQSAPTRSWMHALVAPSSNANNNNNVNKNNGEPFTSVVSTSAASMVDSFLQKNDLETSIKSSQVKEGEIEDFQASLALLPSDADISSLQSSSLFHKDQDRLRVGFPSFATSSLISDTRKELESDALQRSTHPQVTFAATQDTVPAQDAERENERSKTPKVVQIVPAKDLVPFSSSTVPSKPKIAPSKVDVVRKNMLQRVQEWKRTEREKERDERYAALFPAATTATAAQEKNKFLLTTGSSLFLLKNPFQSATTTALPLDDEDSRKVTKPQLEVHKEAPKTTEKPKRPLKSPRSRSPLRFPMTDSNDLFEEGPSEVVVESGSRIMSEESAHLRLGSVGHRAKSLKEQEIVAPSPVRPAQPKPSNLSGRSLRL